MIYVILDVDNENDDNCYFYRKFEIIEVFMMKKENILGIDVCKTTYKGLMDSISKDIEKNNKSFIVAINPEKILKSRKDEELKKLLNSATYQIADGIGVIYASKLKKGSIKERITGVDTMEKICELAAHKGYKIFMYGAKEEVVQQAKSNLEAKFKGIQIVGTINGYEKDNDKIIKIINKVKPNIIFVAMGSPKQELWIRDNMNKIDANIFQGVGGSFDVFSGTVKRAPLIMRKMGMEWLHRLIKDPKRIGRQLKLFGFLGIVFFNKKRSDKNEI